MRVLSVSAVGFAFFAAFHLSAPQAQAFPIQFGLSPDNSQSLLTRTIDSADKEILINVYQFDSPEIQKAIIAKIDAGVTVRILLEGQPMGKISTNGMTTLHAIAHAMHS
jgi:phosphatidylserine/phosphatidylglycerophosphate/cardiolipin synthase-like enzyme